MPLSQLIAHQVTKLTSLSFKACEVTDHAEVLKALSDDTTHMFTSPEVFCTSFMDVMSEHVRSSSACSSAAVSHVFIDETHCVTQW